MRSGGTIPGEDSGCVTGSLNAVQVRSSAFKTGAQPVNPEHGDLSHEPQLEIRLKILVLVKDVLDTRIPLECVEETGRLEEGWNVPVLNPDDRAALSQACNLRRNIAGTHVTALHLGAVSGERYLRDALALGCDEVSRIWDDGLENLHTEGKGLILARAAEILGFDLLLAGTKSLDTCGARLGVLLASTLGVPCMTHVSRIDEILQNTVTATRALARGWREQVASALPLVMTVESNEDPVPYPAFPDVARAAQRLIPCLDLADIGISREAVKRAESRLVFGPLNPPMPGLQYIQPPDSSLPAFDRRRQLGEGAVQKRRGRMVKGSEDEVAERLFQALLEHGWLDHLSKAIPKASDDPDPV